VADTRWVRSSRSLANGNCPEAAARGGRIAVRDSRDPDGPVLTFGGSTWGRFADALRRGPVPG